METEVYRARKHLASRSLTGEKLSEAIILVRVLERGNSGGSITKFADSNIITVEKVAESENSSRRTHHAEGLNEESTEIFL